MGTACSGTGEHVVVLRPTPPSDAANERTHTEAVLEVYVREGAASRKWTRLHAQPLTRPSGGHE